MADEIKPAGNLPVVQVGGLPLVSVIVPALNEADVIRRCLDSVLAQDYPAVEVILVDDGSNDGTPGLAPGGVRVLHTAGRTGAGAARNFGAREAKGSVLFFTDADCMVPADWVNKAMSVMRQQAVRCGGGGYAGAIGQSFCGQFAFYELQYRRRHYQGFVQTLVGNNMFFDRQVFLDVGGFPEQYRSASSEDMELSWALSEKGEKLFWISDNGVYHDFPGGLGYFKQQARFARDAVVMYLHHMRLVGGKTHHGKLLYLEFLMAGMAPWVVLFGWPWLGLGLIAGVFCINLPFLIWVGRKNTMLFAVGAAGAIFGRDAVAVWGLMAGSCRVLMGAYRR